MVANLVLNLSVLIPRRPHAAKRIETGLFYLVQILLTMTTMRPLLLHHTNHYCHDMTISAVVMGIALLTASPFAVILLLSFLHGAGPLPPPSPYMLETGGRLADMTDMKSVLRPFAHNGAVRCAVRVGGYKYAVRLLGWKLTQLAKVSVGWWDRDALLATRVMPRAEVYLSHSLRGDPEGHARGLQMHQGRTLRSL